MGLKEDMQNEMENIKGDLATVSKAFHELKTEKYNRKIKVYRFVTIILAILLIVTNSLWLIYRMSLEKVVETTTETTTIEAQQDGTGVNIVGGGNVEYGTTSENNYN